MKFVDPMLLQTVQDPGRYTGRAGLYRIEEKLDGWRGVLSIGPKGSQMWTRNRTKIDGFSGFMSQGLTVVDGEILSPDRTASSVAASIRDGSARFHCFDVLFCNGEDIRSKPLSNRLTYVDFVLKEYGLPGVRKVESADAVWAEGGEGAVIKRLDSPYISAARSWAWLKWKRHCSTSSE